MVNSYPFFYNILFQFVFKLKEYEDNKENR